MLMVKKKKNSHLRVHLEESIIFDVKVTISLVCSACQLQHFFFFRVLYNKSLIFFALVIYCDLFFYF